MRLAASRYLKDRRRADLRSPPFIFSAEHAWNHCDFIEKLPHVEGTWTDADGNIAPYIILHPAHIFFLVNLFGFRNHEGGRRFTSALLCIARKNAKSLLSAGIMLSCMCLEEEQGPKLLSAATTGDQARMVWRPAKQIVEREGELREAFGLEPFANAIACWPKAGTFIPINAKASTQDGLNPSHVAFDEIHAHKTHDLLNVLQSAAGARRNPLWLYTTTEGYETPGPWPELRQFAYQVLHGIVEADHFFPLIFAVDDEIGKPGDANYRPADDDFDESKWIKANPLMTVNPVLLDQIRKAAQEAKQMPGRHAEFRIKRLNRQSASQKAWIDLERWKRCGGAVDLKALIGKPCWAGLDLASTRDLAALRFLWRVDGIYYTWGKRWVPQWAVEQRTERGSVPYAGWVAAGLITQTEGDTVDYEIIEKDIIELAHRFTPREIAFDRWNAVDLVNRLQAANLPMVEFRQGPKSYHPAMQELEKCYIAGNLRHGNDQVLNWCASNLVPRKDANLNMAPDKARSADKIDDMAALLMAFGRALVIPENGDIDNWLKS